MKAKEIGELLHSIPVEELPERLREFETDTRSSVQALVRQYARKYAAYEKEVKRLDALMAFDAGFSEAGYLCGIDEAGRGPYAGPVVAAAVVLPKNCRILYLNDSKQLTEQRREMLYDEIMEKAVSVGVGVVGPERIDAINILQADYEAMREALSKLSVTPDLLLNDAVTIPGVPIRQKNIVHGDAKSLSIAAASVIAKVTRDRMMVLYDELYPQYGFAQHKGYGSAAHEEAIRKFGLCPIHRRSFTGKFSQEPQEDHPQDGQEEMIGGRDA